MIHIIDATESSFAYLKNYLSNNQFSDVSYRYNLQDGVLTLSIQIIYPEHINLDPALFSIPIDIQQYAGKYITVKILHDMVPRVDNGGLDIKYLSPALDVTYNNLYSNGYVAKDMGSKRFMTLYITKDGNDIYLHPFYRMHSNKIVEEGFDYIEADITDENHMQLLLDACPEFADYIDKWNLKKNLLDSAIDVSKSAAYLEAEVDALYKIIGLLLKNTEIDVSEYQPIIDAVERHNVLDIKNIDKLVAEIDEDKENIRRRQENYYDKAY